MPTTYKAARKVAHNARRKTIKASEKVEKLKTKLREADEAYSQALQEEREAWNRLSEIKE